MQRIDGAQRLKPTAELGGDKVTEAVAGLAGRRPGVLVDLNTIAGGQMPAP